MEMLCGCGIDEPSMQGWAGISDNDAWQRYTLPIGNGDIGANIYGEITTEKLTFNEKNSLDGRSQ